MAKKNVVMRHARFAELDVELTFKTMKNIRLKLCPPNGVIKISAPFGTDPAVINRFVCDHKPWIQQQRAKQRSVPTRQEFFEHGAIHRFFGREMQLSVTQNSRTPNIEIDETNAILHLYLDDNSPQSIERALDKYYREQMREKIPPMLEKWQPVVGKTVNEWRIRKMKTRWGSCNIACRRIWLSLELAKKPLQCLEYVLVHELTHLHERYHNGKFYRLMDQFLPNWRDIKEELN